jgi:serine/threonine protein kinase
MSRLDAPSGYSRLEVLDHGGFAVVYRAHDDRFDRTVALKVLDLDGLDERELRRFRAECMATGRVSAHPNIVTVYDAGTTPGHRPWVAMEYCSGGSLAGRLEAHGPLPVPEVLDIGTKLASALHAAHSAGILHRDVKPQNVLITQYGEPALADFGIALITAEDDVADSDAFTLLHTAPEVLEGHDATVASDVYSLGSTLYTLLAGRPPFAAEASVGLAPLVSRVLRGDVPPLRRTDLPEGLEDVLLRAMSARPGERPSSAGDLGSLLAQFTAPGTTTRTSAGSLAQVPSPAAPAAPRPEAFAQPVSGEQPVSPESPTSLAGCAPRPGSSAERTHRRSDLPELEGLVSQAKATAGSKQSRSRPLLLVGVVGLVALLGIVGGVVWGLNSAGKSPAPQPGRTQVADDLPPDEANARAPRDVTVTGGDGGSLDISWTLPDPEILPLVRLEPAPPPGAHTPVINQGDEQVTYAGLEAGTTYCATVIGFTKQGDQINAGQGRNARACGTPR